MISSSASAASSSSSREDAMPSTPSSDRRMASHPTGPAVAPPITPQNPFDQIAAAPSAVSTVDFLISAELTPPRSPATSISPNPSGSSVSAPTTPVTLRGAPSLPQSAPPMMHTNAASLTSAISPGPPRLTQRLPPSGPTVVPAATSSTTASTGVSQPVFDDDENTEPSSANNSQQAQQPYPQGVDPAVVAGSFARFLETTRRRLSTSTLGAARGVGGGRGGPAADSDEDDAMLDATDGVLIAGYLQKLGRNGKWQTRWFETDGECLSYYKSSKRNKLLATLDLAKVGHIETDETDSRGCSFTIQVLGRLYHLRANSRASCKDWVITLNRVKEARLNQGNTKLVHDLLEPDTDAVAPRVVVVANRQRTRAVDESQAWENMINSEENPAVEAAYDPYDQKRRSALGNVVLARWTKRRSSLSRLGAKLARWARSLKKYRCSEVEVESVQLDRHVHPPGHDDKTKKQRSTVQPATVAQPSRVTRALSSASEDDARFIA